MTTANSFEKIESINLNDDIGNNLEIVLLKNKARVWKIDYLLNGIPVRALKMTGSNAATAQWQMIQNLIKCKANKNA
jgi:hypothetical protein